VGFWSVFEFVSVGNSLESGYFRSLMVFFSFHGVFFFFHNEAELRESSMYSDFGVCAPSQEGLAQATEL